MNTVYLDGYDSALYVEEPAAVAGYAERFQALTDQALNAEGTAELIGTMIGSDT